MLQNDLLPGDLVFFDHEVTFWNCPYNSMKAQVAFHMVGGAVGLVICPEAEEFLMLSDTGQLGWGFIAVGDAHTILRS